MILKEEEEPYPEGAFMAPLYSALTADIVVGLHLINHEPTYYHALVTLISAPIIIYSLYKIIKIHKYGLPEEDIPKYLEPEEGICRRIYNKFKGDNLEEQEDQSQ